MLAVESLLADVRAHYAADPDLSRILMNATSWLEANLAVQLLADLVPERALVTAANIREAVKELPQCPLAMRVDLETLARVASLERDGMAWSRTYHDSEGDYSIALLGDGNYCYDIVVRTAAGTIMWMPADRECDFLNPEIVDLMMERPTLLGNVIDLLQAMGLTFYPSFYLSLDDWRQEYAAAVFGEIIEGFDRFREPAVVEKAQAEAPRPKHRPRRRKKATPKVA